MNKKLIGIIILIVVVIFNTVCFAANTESTNEIVEETETTTEENPQEVINNYVYTIINQGLTKQNLTDLINKYKELSEDYSNEEIAEMIDITKEKLKNDGISSENIESIENINKVIKNTKAENLKQIIETIDIDTSLKELSEGATIYDLVKETNSKLTTSQKADLFASLILSSKIIYTIITSAVFLGVYTLITRGIIYKKAGKHFWAIFIPIYRDVTMLKICKLSPWLLLLAFVPIIGWFILWVISVMCRFLLAEKFGKGELFGLGLWLFWPIFGGILALSKKAKYIKD